MSVFDEENAILQELRESEQELETLGGDSDADRMQEILDRMQDLQNKAEAKGVYALESRCKKIMDLMGFTDDEGYDLVASFSGGWKMRIGLGKVLLKDPNVLLLGTYPHERESLLSFRSRHHPSRVCVFLPQMSLPTILTLRVWSGWKSSCVNRTFP